MMSRVFQTAVFSMTLAMVGANGSAALAEELFRSAESLEEIVGRVDMRRAYGARLEVIVECPSRPTGCRDVQAYGDLIRLDFHLRTQEVRGETTVVDEEPAGSIFMATDFDGTGREEFLAELEQLLIALPATAFDLSLAGLGPGRPPFDKSTLAHRSLRPTWVCFRMRGTTRAVRFFRRSDGSDILGVGATHYDIPPTPVCDEIAAATEGSYAETYWTLSAPRRLLERVVDYVDTVWLSEDTRALVPRPAGVQFVKQRMSNEASMDSMAVGEDDLSRATHAANGWRYDAWAPPTAMPIAALDENAWLQAWTIRTELREFGADPTSRVLAESTTYVAIIPTVPAAHLAATKPDGSYQVSPTGHLEEELVEPVADEPPSIDRASFVNQVVQQLEAEGGDPHEPIDRFLIRPVRGLVSEGWLVVVCQPDGRASYSLPPTRAGNRLTNADLFCAALEARIE